MDGPAGTCTGVSFGCIPLLPHTVPLGEADGASPNSLLRLDVLSLIFMPVNLTDS